MDVSTIFEELKIENFELIADECLNSNRIENNPRKIKKDELINLLKNNETNN